MSFASGSWGDVQDSESELRAALGSRDPSAFERLVRSHAGPMLAIARRYLGDEADAQDAVQAAFRRALRMLDERPFRGDVTPWLRQLVVDAALRGLRERSVPEAGLEAWLPRFDENGAFAEPPAALHSDDSDALRGRVRSAVDRLPDAYRIVLVLCDFDELDAPTTARLLGLNERVVRHRLHRARQALQTLIARGG